jgi:hypothetical protein
MKYEKPEIINNRYHRRHQQYNFLYPDPGTALENNRRKQKGGHKRKEY